ncbi:hypothetical protein CsSME_00006320 [Camellia sinensis var. sinensis]
MYCKALHGELAGDIAVVGRIFGISIIVAIRVGLLLAPGGEFAFVAFGEAVYQGIMSCQMSSLLFLEVGVSIALTPWLAAGGQLLASRFELHDVWSLLPVDYETDDLQDHIIIVDLDVLARSLRSFFQNDLFHLLLLMCSIKLVLKEHVQQQ